MLFLALILNRVSINVEGRSAGMFDHLLRVSMMGSGNVQMNARDYPHQEGDMLSEVVLLGYDITKHVQTLEKSNYS